MADFALPISLNSLLDFVFGNITFFLLFGAIAYIIYNYLTVGSKKALKPVDRSEVERLRFIDRLKNNQTELRYLYRGKYLIGAIKSLTALDIPLTTDYDKRSKTGRGRPKKEEKDGQKEEKRVKVVQMVIKPTISRIIRIENPLSKAMAFQINAQNINIDHQNKKVVIDETAYIDKYFGIFYDKNNEFIHTAQIRKDNILRTDIDKLASIYYAKSQEQSTFDPEHAHSLALKEKEIQLELAKRSSKMSQI